MLDTLPPTARRVEQNSDPAINDAIRERTDAEVVRLEGAGDEEIAQRLRELDREWDIERTLQANASVLAIAGVLLGAKVNRWFLLLPTAVFSFLGNHALQGWCPPVPLFRRLGVRTQREIERERYALKALRGDFDTVPRRAPPRKASGCAPCCGRSTVSAYARESTCSWVRMVGTALGSMSG